MMEQWRSRKTPRGFGCLAFMLAALAFGTCLLPIAVDAESAFGVVLGIPSLAVFSMVLVAFSVLGPGSLWLRWFGGLAIGILWFVVFCWTIAGVGGPPDFAEVLVGVLMLPSSLLALQMPLFVYQLLTGNRLLPKGTVPRDQPPRRGQFTISQIMQATAIIAVVLSCPRLAMYVDGGLTQLDFWSVQLFLGIVLLVVCCMFFLPAWLAGLSSAPVGKCSLPLAVYGFVLSCFFPLLIAAGSHDIESFVKVVISSVGTLYLILFGGFFAIRLLCASGFYVYRPESIATDEVATDEVATDGVVTDVVVTDVVATDTTDTAQDIEEVPRE